MKNIFDPLDEPPDEELSTIELHDRWEQSTNLSAAELRAFRDSEYNAAYLAQNSDQAQGGNEPLNDAIMLATTPADEWGAEERSEALEALDWIDRHGSQAEDGLGENFLTDNERVTKREAAGIRWGVDWDDDREWL
jgi:hypothetical protein